MIQDSQWWASWYGGVEAIPSPGHGCLTAFQGLERHNGVPKQALPDGYERLGMVAVHERVLAAVRAIQKKRQWVNQEEEILDEITIRGERWPGGVLPSSVNNKLLRGDWLTTGRMDWQEASAIGNFA